MIEKQGTTAWWMGEIKEGVKVKKRQEYLNNKTQ